MTRKCNERRGRVENYHLGEVKGMRKRWRRYQMVDSLQMEETFVTTFLP